ncbi:hypothetical protein [uncultured Brachyspira sp.]|uniref:hypothetical protein n=1 Tax=uncultured Brachyspira sp. TaxID=221953 RepID=UPI0026054E97|nr:hypothetical protein [uncultured Brachyspira sp.]
MSKYDISKSPEELIYLGHYINLENIINRGLTIDEYQYKSCLIQIIKNKKLQTLNNKKMKFNELFISNPISNNQGISTKALDLFIEKYASKYKDLYAYDMEEGGFFTRYAKKKKLKEKKVIFDTEYTFYQLN